MVEITGYAPSFPEHEEKISERKICSEDFLVPCIHEMIFLLSIDINSFFIISFHSPKYGRILIG